VKGNGIRTFSTNNGNGYRSRFINENVTDMLV